MILAGRGAGKTRCGAEWVRGCVCGPTPLGGGVYSRLALVAETAADARDVIVEGPAGLLAIHPADFRPKFERSKRRLTWPNGAVAMLYNATEPDQLRGPQHEAAWCDELAKWRYARETWDMLQFGLRLGERPRQVITTTPRPIPLIREFLAREGQGVAVTRGSTYDNRANLAPGFFKSIVKRYEGTRLGRQELNAEILDDIPGALWTRAMLDARARGPCGAAADAAHRDRRRSGRQGLRRRGQDFRDRHRGGGAWRGRARLCARRSVLPAVARRLGAEGGRRVRPATARTPSWWRSTRAARWSRR